MVSHFTKTFQDPEEPFQKPLFTRDTLQRLIGLKQIALEISSSHLKIKDISSSNHRFSGAETCLVANKCKSKCCNRMLWDALSN